MMLRSASVHVDQRTGIGVAALTTIVVLLIAIHGGP
jgi:hypothetical protein